MVDLELYRIFKIVADEQNLTKASKILNISQPAVTKHIHNLENELNLKLFTRTRYGMTLTQDGEKLFNQIKDAISILINAEYNIKSVTTLNIGVHTNMPKDLYRSVIAKLKEKNSNIEINIEKAPTETMFSMLEQQKIDAYLSKKQSNDLHSNSIKFIGLGMFHDNFFVNANSKYLDLKKLQDKKETLTIYTLRKVSSTSDNLEKIIKENNLKNVKIKNVTFNTIIEEMQNKDIIAYITEEYIAEELKNGILKKLNLKFQTYDMEYGIYYNSSNKIKNIKKLLNIK